MRGGSLYTLPAGAALASPAFSPSQREPGAEGWHFDFHLEAENRELSSLPITPPITDQKMIKTPASEVPLAPRVRVTKLDAARRQLRAAITLWFDEGDEVAIHSLACAAHQIIHDINQDRGGKELLYDSLCFKEEHRKKVHQRLREGMRFFKHADRDPDPQGEIEFAPLLSELFIMMSLRGLEYFEEELDAIEGAFMLWYGFKHPEFLTEKGSAQFGRLTENVRHRISSMPGREFFELYRKGSMLVGNG